MSTTKRLLACFLVICTLITYIPLEGINLAWADGAVVGKDGGSVTGGGKPAPHGGVLDYNPIFRVSIKREKDVYYNGTPESFSVLQESFAYKYPEIKSLDESLFFISPSTPISGSAKLGLYNTRNLTPQSETNSQITMVKLGSASGSGTSLNIAKAAILSDKGTGWKELSDLQQGKWQKYLGNIDVNSSIRIWNYVFAKTGGTYDVKKRLEGVISSHLKEGVNLQDLTPDQKTDVAAGYAGILMSLFKVAQSKGHTILAGAYSAAIDDFLEQSNLQAKPVGLIIDTAIAISIKENGYQQLVVPSIDYIEYTTLTTASNTVTLGDRPFKGGAKGNTKSQLLSSATESLKEIPFSVTSQGKGGIIRHADANKSGTAFQQSLTNKVFVVTSGIPGWKKTRFRSSPTAVTEVGYGSTDAGYTELLNLGGLTQGFIVASVHIVDEKQEVMFGVDNTTQTMQEDACTPIAQPIVPPVGTLTIRGQSGKISSLISKREIDPNYPVKIEGRIEREVSEIIDGSEATIEGRAVVDSMTAALQELNSLSIGELAKVLQGQPIVLRDSEILNRVYERSEDGGRTIIYKYYIEGLKITIGNDVTEYKHEDIVNKSEGVALNFSPHKMSSFSTKPAIPEDIVIPAKSKTPSMNEVQSVKIQDYEFNTGGDNAYAEIKSNTPNKERYEAMAGIPSTEEIYFAAGGHEYKLSVIFQYWVNEHSRDRTYRSFFTGVECEFKDPDMLKGNDSGYMEGSETISIVPQTSVGYNIAAQFHNGPTNIYSNWSGGIPNNSTATVEGIVQPTGTPCQGDPGNPGYMVDNPNWDTSKYNTDYANADAWKNAIASKKIYKTADSDDIYREWLTLASPSLSSSHAPGPLSSDFQPGHSENTGSAASGAPTGCPHGCTQQWESPPVPAGPDGSGGSPGVPHVHNHNCGTWSGFKATTYTKLSDSFSINVDAGTMSAHHLCGPCCQHDLPLVEDTWRQGIVYDFVSISQIRLYKLDQASVTGLQELTGADEIFAVMKNGDPTYFMNIARLTEQSERPPIIPSGPGGFPNPYDALSTRNTYYGGYSQGRILAQSSKAGRLRYSVEPTQHDDVVWPEGQRDNFCDGTARTVGSTNPSPSGGNGHNEHWGKKGILYNHPVIGSGYKAYDEDYDHHNVVVGTKSTFSRDTVDSYDKATREWQKFDERRRTPNVATVISDFLILQTSGGDQSIFYFHKQTEPYEAQEHFPKLKITEDEAFTSNPNSIFNKKEEVCGGTPLKVDPEFVNIGGYNGHFKLASTNESSNLKYHPYNLVTKQFLTVNGDKVTTFLDSDPAQDIKRPNRTGKLYLMEDKIKIKTTVPNKLYTPKSASVFYKQELAFYSMDYDLGYTIKKNVDLGESSMGQHSSNLRKWGDVMGLTYVTKYNPEADDEVNGVVVYTPVSTEDAIVLPLDDINVDGKMVSRDQRVNRHSIPNLTEEINKYKICPLDPGTCEFRTLDCKYLQDTLIGDFDFEPKYTTVEKRVSGGQIKETTVTKNNTYRDGSFWITTNKVNGIEYKLPTGFTIGNAGKVGSGQYLNAFGTRWSIPFSDLGISGDSANRLFVEMDLLMETNSPDKSMLVSFWGYDFWLNPNNGSTLGMFNTGNGNAGLKGAATVPGNGLNRKVKVGLEFSFNNIMDSKAYINGVPVPVTVTADKLVWEYVNGVRKQVQKVVTITDPLDAPDNLTRQDIGSTFNIGSWGRNDVYPASYYIDNLKIYLKGGTHTHNSSCYKEMKVCERRMIHVHDANCYAKVSSYPTCTHTLNSNYQVSCGNSPLNYYGSPSCGYSQGVSCGLTESGSGTYNLVASDDDSGPGLEAYIRHYLTAGQSIKIQMGGYAGRDGSARLTTNGPSYYHNSGIRSYSGYFESSGSYVHEFVVQTSGYYTFETSERTADPYLGLYVRDGHRHVSTCYHYHSGSPGTSPSGCYTSKNTHRHTGTAGQGSANGCYTNPTSHSHTAACGEIKKDQLICTGELNTISDLNYHVHSAACLENPVTLPATTYQYTGGVQVYTAQVSGEYTLEAWGAQGGESSTGTFGGRGAYTKGTVYLDQGERIYVYVGQQGDKFSGNQTSPVPFNGGGKGYGGGGDGGGSTDFRLSRGGTWNDSDSLLSRIMVAAGGGGSMSSSSGGNGGSLTGSNGNVGLGGTQTSSGGGTGGIGGFGYGGGRNTLSSVTASGGGGGGYYGGSSGRTSGSGGGGSSFISGYTGCNARTLEGTHSGRPIHHTGKVFSSATMTAGANQGHGRAKITPPSVGTGVLGNILAGNYTEAQVKEYLGSELTTQILSSPKLLHTWSGWSTSNMKGFEALGGANLSVVSSNLRLTLTPTSTWEARVPVNISDGRAISEIRITLDNNTPLTSAGISRNSYVNSVYTTVLAQTNNQVLSFKPNWTGAVNYINLDLMSGTSNGSTVTIKKIELLGHGTKSAGSGEASGSTTLKYASGSLIQQFNFTGSAQSLTLAPGKYRFEAWGAQGNSGTYSSAGGLGGYARGDMNLTSSTVLWANVGGQNGWNGGGSGGTGASQGYNGGGASDIRIGGTALGNRVIVAGGGGGGGGHSNGGAPNDRQSAKGGLGGDAHGGNGTEHNNSGSGKLGTAASNSSGGSGGSGGSSGSSSNTDGAYYQAGGGGGGGGYYGGGGGGSGAMWGGTTGSVSGRSGSNGSIGSGGSGGNASYNSSPMAYWSYPGGGGGAGSSWTGSLTNTTTTAGARSGNGLVAIRAAEDIFESTYSFTSLQITYSNPLTSAKSTILANVHLIPETLSNGKANPIFVCGGLPFTEHRHTANCKVTKILECKEPHHIGEHYDGSSRICWKPCGIDENHHTVKPEVEVSPGRSVRNAKFLQIDLGFRVYFPNRGDFAGNNALGISTPQEQTGYGYRNRMDTTQWTREKRIKFDFNVIYEGDIYIAGEWIELPVPQEYFDFYIVLSNLEMSNASVDFEVEAINCGVESQQELQFSSSLDTRYATSLSQFKTNLQSRWRSTLQSGLKTHRKTTQYGYRDYFDWKQGTAEKSLLTGSITYMRNLINSEFPVINEKAKPMTSNDNLNRVSNIKRTQSLESLHGGYKNFYLDVIGRVGNFTILDTEDYRFSNTFKLPKENPPKWMVEGFIYEVDQEIQNYYVGDPYDIRGNKISPTTRWLNTYGTQTWMEGMYEGGRRNINNPNIITQALSGDLNTIAQLKKEQLRFGYDIYTSINTIGSYQKGNMIVTPYYYGLDLDTGRIYPVDVYISKDGLYRAVNKFNNVYEGTEIETLYKYNLNLDWTKESERRNFTLQEQLETNRAANFLKELIYDYGGYNENNLPPYDYNAPLVGEKHLKLPQGTNNYLGTSQLMILDGGHRTFIGGTDSHGGVAENAKWGIDKNPGGRLLPVTYTTGAQRWHFKVGVPSSAVFVKQGVKPDKNTIKAVMNDNNVIISTVSIVAVGDEWAIEYTQPWMTELKIHGKSYDVKRANLPPIIGVYASDKSSILDVDIIDSH